MLNFLVNFSKLLTDDLHICCQNHHSEQHFPLNFVAVGFGLRNIRKKLYLTLELPSLTHTSVRYHALRVPRPNLAPTNTNIVGYGTNFNILCRKFFICF